MSDEKRTYRLTAANTITPKAPSWLWAEKMPVGCLGIAAGRGGEGKSSFALWMAALLSLGLLPGAHYGTPRDTIIVGGEDSWAHIMVPRLIAAGADLSRIHRLDILTESGTETSPRLPIDINNLEAAIRYARAALVVIDPLISTISGDSYKAAETRQSLEPLVRVIEATGCAALGILHFSKAAQIHAGNAINGSTAFRDLARSVFLFARDQETDVRVMSQDKNSYARDDGPSLEYTLVSTAVPVEGGVADVGRFEWLGESDQSVRDIMLGAEGDEDDRSEAERWLMHKLEDLGGSGPAKDILRDARRDGFPDRTMQRARKRIADSSKSGFGGAWVWTLNHKDAAKAPKMPPPQGQAPMASMAPSVRADLA
ncbi:MAG: AAA family ATPase [Actinomycetota bacterium]|nr:AAA family ATPase [Actinomycetota bacterium]